MERGQILLKIKMYNQEIQILCSESYLHVNRDTAFRTCSYGGEAILCRSQTPPRRPVIICRRTISHQPWPTGKAQTLTGFPTTFKLGLPLTWALLGRGVTRIFKHDFFKGHLDKVRGIWNSATSSKKIEENFKCRKAAMTAFAKKKKKILQWNSITNINCTHLGGVGF